jgi:hypothetical protein
MKKINKRKEKKIKRKKISSCLELGVDTSWPDLELSGDVLLPNLELGAGMPWSNVELDTDKDITSF